jgi:hypothetical protein
MAFSQTDVDALKAAIAKGVSRVRIDGEEVQYNTFSDMRAALRMMEAELAGSASATPRVVYPKTTRGL